MLISPVERKAQFRRVLRGQEVDPAAFRSVTLIAETFDRLNQSALSRASDGTVC